MKIKNKLTYLFALIVGTLMLVFSVSIYFFYSQYREIEFMSRLKVRALSTAELIAEVEELNPELIQQIESKTVALLYDEHMHIFFNRKEIYRTGTKQMIEEFLLNKIEKKGEYHFELEKKEAIGITYNHRDGQYIIIVSGYDKYGHSKLNILEAILIVSWLIFILIVIGLGRFFADKALRPIEDVVNQVDRITVSNLSARVEIGELKEKDELQRLAFTFNKMLERLEYSFEIQKSFVANASHELRTPLTSVRGQLEVGLISDRSTDEYKQILNSSLDDLKSLNELLNGLLELAQTDFYASEMKFSPVRIDELLFTVIEICQRKHQNIPINFEYESLPEDEDMLIVKANEQWLKTAILNVIDNACKYSNNKPVRIVLNITDVWLVIKVVDQGIGIPEGDVQKIIEPFYRSSNTKSIAGHGIGLSLSNRIMRIHHGNIQIYSTINQGTKVLIALPLKNN